jgi:hypothetical protein
MNHITDNGGGINTPATCCVLSSGCARECKLKLTRGFCRAAAVNSRRVCAVLSSNQPHIGSEIYAARHSALLKIFQLVCARAHAFKAAAASARFISARTAGILFLLPANSVSAADRKSHPMQQRRYLARQWNLLPLGLLGGGTQ